MNSTIETLKKRRSIRVYKSEPIERSVIESIIDCGRLAPTAMNEQPWDFIVLTDREDLRRVPGMLGHGEFIANAAFAVLVLARKTEYAVEDCCAATENLLIAAAALGVGACWIAGTKQAYGPGVVKEFGAPPDRQLIAIVSFGFPAEEPEVDKRPLSDVLHWNRF